MKTFVIGIRKFITISCAITFLLLPTALQAGILSIPLKTKTGLLQISDLSLFPTPSLPSSAGIVLQNLVPPKDPLSGYNQKTSTSPASFGFVRNHRCHDEYIPLPEAQNPEACLNACKSETSAMGCWWLDRTNENSPECRACINDTPQEDIYDNDWGITLSETTRLSDTNTSGFKQGYKCIGSTVILDDAKTSQACADTCKTVPLAKGCWWQEGFDEKDPICRVCPNETPTPTPHPSSWGLSLADSSSTTLPDPSILGFSRFNKCAGSFVSLGDTIAPEACLIACRSVPSAKGCWWMDGTGGHARECRACPNSSVIPDRFGNDWGRDLSSNSQ